MARRSTPKAALKFDRLESREVLSSGGPTAEIQQMIELTNFARQHPAQAADWAGADQKTDSLGLTLRTFDVNLDQARRDIASKPVAQPLAWNDQLANAALTQSRFMAERGIQTHDGGGTLADGTVVGVTMDDRISNAGYTNRSVSGENAFAYSTSVDNAMQAFLIDWGNDPAVKPHLTNIMRRDYREVGIGIVNTKGKGLGPKVITQDFAARAGAKAMLLGVVFDDSVKGDNFYQAGEGKGDVAIDVTDAKGQTQTVSTWDAGGYQIALDPGVYQVTARVGNRVFRKTSVTIGSENVKLDFNLSQPWDNTPVTPPAPVVVTPPAPVAVTPPAPVVVPVVTPTPAVVIPTTPAVVAKVETLAVAPVSVSIPTRNQTPVTVTVKSTPVDISAAQTKLLSSSAEIQWESW